MLHAMRTYLGLKVHLPPFLTSAVDGADESSSRASKKEPPVPTRQTAEWVPSRSGRGSEEKNPFITPAGN